MSDASGADLNAWIGRTSESHDILTPRLAASFRATLSPHLVETDDAAAPPGVHWLLAPDIVEAARLGRDGHPGKGVVLPPVPLPRRMWAGGALRLLAPLRVGDHVRRRSTIAAITAKRGGTGPLCFVTVRHLIENDHGPAVEEDQIIVYREDDAPERGASEGAAPPAPHQAEVAVDSVMLFRYSALTFNGHRIHYDAPYASAVENYPGLVIHGPLQATLLLNFAARIGGHAPRSFSFRGQRAATGAQSLRLRASPEPNGDLALHVERADGRVTMTASARWSVLG